MAAAEQREAEGVDDLRRRLYRADASDADLQRYLAVRQLGAEPEAEVVADGRRSGRRPAIAAVAAVAGVLVAGSVATGVLLHQSVTAPARAAAAVAHPVAVDIGDGTLLATEPDHLTGPTRTAAVIDGQATVAERFDGLGDQVVAVHLPDAASGDARAVLVLDAERPSTISWRALRLTTRRDWTSYQEVVASGRVAARLDVGTPAGFGYAGAPPTKLVVEAAPDVRWTLLVAPVEDVGADLH